MSKNKNKIKLGPVVKYKYFDNTIAFENWQQMYPPLAILAIQPVSKELNTKTEFKSKWWQFWRTEGITKSIHIERIFVTYKDTI